MSMAIVVPGVVSNGVVIPASALPEGAQVEVCVKSDSNGVQSPTTQKLSLSELLKLPPSERDVILAAAAVLAEKDYLEDKELTGFDAFSEELDDDADEG
jgi:hypothetical protein